MGIPMSVDVREPAPPGAATAVEAAFALLDAADRRFSPYRFDSELSRINRGERLIASPEMVEVLGLAEDARAASGGAFDCHDPNGRLDTNGVVKGWAAQRAADVLVAAGITSFCLNAGGDVVVRGAPEPGRRWHVAVRSPTGKDPLAVLALQDAAVATSGSYERGDHIWDRRPASAGRPLASVTVVAGDLGTADVLATTLFVLGADGIDWAVTTYGCVVLAVDDRGLLHTGGELSPLLARPDPHLPAKKSLRLLGQADGSPSRSLS